MRKFVSFFGDRSSIFEKLNLQAENYARSKGFEYTWAPQIPYDKHDVIAHLKENDVGLIDVEPYDESIFSSIHNRCKLLIRFGVGYDKVDLAAASQYGICIARTSGANSSSVAEMALTHILALKRQIFINRKVIESGYWEKNVGSQTIGSTVGIVGFGTIGQVLAKLLMGFGCRILAYDPYPNLDKMKELGVEYSDLIPLVEQADAISIHVPYSKETYHLFGKQLISCMKKNAILVCTARGNIVDETALYDALVAGQIAGAGLDVFRKEPLPASSPLIGLSNVVLTPHVASQTIEALWAIYKKAIDIASDYFSGKPLASSDLLNPDVLKLR